MNRALIAAAILSLPACIVYSNDRAPAPANFAPVIGWAEAGCFWDERSYDWVWYFDAEVADPDGFADLTDVYADVLDDWDGRLVDSFQLEDYGGGEFSTAWFQWDTYLDCRSGPYRIEFVAYDIFDAWDVYATYPIQDW